MLAMRAAEHYTSPVAFIDLRDHVMPLCDGSSEKPEAALALIDKLEAAHTVLIASPVYNYDLNAAAKNLIEWTGRAWSEKVVAFALAAGGKNAYMAPLAFMNSLMIDFRCIIVPKYVYADRSAFDKGTIAPDIDARLAELVRTTTALGHALP